MMKEKLVRMVKAMNMLKDFLEEEFSYLKNRKLDKISSLEVCIQSLLEQLEVEKKELRKIAYQAGHTKINEFLNFISTEREELNTLVKELSELERKVKILSAKNNALAMALARQAVNMFSFLQAEISKKGEDNFIYTNTGKLLGRPRLSVRG
ncbi:MAG: flagellar export chaperone FlgN [Desulfonauticus sp.]|nr:flagellar export chaperone FlgN [Desulfonauticus sp.]